MPNLTIESGTLLAAADERTVSGLLVPFGEMCNSNLGQFTVEPGAFTLPRHPSGAVFTDEHDRVVGEAVLLAEEADGIHATFRVDETPAGDEALEAIRTGKRRRLSVETTHVIIQGAKAIAGRVFGGSLVERGAFPSATLLAAEGDTVETSDPVETVEEHTDTYTDEDGNERTRVTTRRTVVDGNKTTITEETVIQEPEAPAEGEAPVPNATVPGTLLAQAPAPVEEAEPVTRAAFARIVAESVRSPERAGTLLAALNDVPFDSAGAIGVDAGVPEYVGEVWSGQPFARKVIPLLLSGALTSLRTLGWRWTTKPAVAAWAGNKTNVPSNTPETEQVSWAFQRFAGGWDIAREFVDFGETEVIQSFLTAAAGDYARKSDAWVLAQLLASATAMTGDTVPTGTPAALAAIVDGALAIIANDARPSYALVNPDDYRPFLFTTKLDGLEYLSMALGLDAGSLEGFKIVPHTGITAGTAMVGAREAAAVHELPGSPIRVNALDLVKGGIDEALFGYVQFRDYYPEGLQLVTFGAPEA